MSTPSRKSRCLQKQHGLCYFCTRRIHLFPVEGERVATWDHLTPSSRGGGTDYHNLCLACEDCNQAKGNLTEAEFAEAARFAGGVHNLWGRSLQWREGQGAFISGTFKLGEILGPLLNDIGWSECGA